MKPQKLVVQAFGPYAKIQKFDFNELGENQLFLIHGPTGGGKSTILDAISFALYGESSGNERDGESMRSDYAAPDLLTQITLEFKVGDRYYRIIRSPRQTRPKQNGEGATTTQPKAEMFLINEHGTELDVIGSKITAVNNEVRRILGFSSEQFRQVIMLPQGQFRDLLTSDSRKREEILEQLFGTHIYRAIERELKEQARILRNKIEEIRHVQRGSLETQGCETSTELEQLSKESTIWVKKLEKVATTLKEKEAKAKEDLIKAEETNNKFLQFDKCKTKKIKIDEKKPAIDQQRKNLVRAKKAKELEDIFLQVTEKISELANAQTELIDSQKAYKIASEESKQALVALENAKTAAKELNTLEVELHDLNRFEIKIKELETTRKEYGEFQEVAKVADEEESNTLKRVAEFKDNLSKISIRLETLSKQQKDIGGLESQIEVLNNHIAAKTKLDELTLLHDKLTNDYTLADNEASKTQKNQSIVRSELGRLETLRLRGQSTVLARSLVDNEPCPVCGSKDHPAPAHGDLEIPSDESIALAVEQVKIAESEKDDAVEALSGCKRSLEVNLSEQTNLRKSLRPVVKDSLETLQTRLSKLESEKTNQSQYLIEEEELRSSREKLKQERADGEVALEKARESNKQNQKTLSAINSRLVEQEKGLPPEYQDLQSLDKKQQSLKKNIGAIKSQLEISSQNHAEKEKSEASAKATVNSCKITMSKVEKAKSELNKKWELRREKAGFKTDDDFSQACTDTDEIDRIEKEITEYDNQSRDATILLEQAQQAIRDIKQPQIESLRESFEEIEIKKAEADLQYTEQREKNKSIAELIKKIKTSEKELKDKESRYGVVGAISQMANGNNGLGLSYSRFVLGALLDDVLIAASDRLELMSKGRYRLLRTDERKSGRSASGLDLIIDDAYTGKSRPVATLSGGESFQAALSLALGLADVVQSYSGGVYLETIFIDEGFGSLDEEALDLAINTLIDLQKSGRLVGVISHVPALKERIDVRLEVKSDRVGSTAEFILP